MKALHFGAGNIGRGFIGKLLADAGITLTFADVNQVVLDALNARHSYQVHVVGENEQVETVSGVNAVSSIGDDVIDLIASVDLVMARRLPCTPPSARVFRSSLYHEQTGFQRMRRVIAKGAPLGQPQTAGVVTAPSL